MRGGKKKTLKRLENDLLAHNAMLEVSNMGNAPDGLDFEFSEKRHASKFVDFLRTMVPCRMKTSKKLIRYLFNRFIMTFNWLIVDMDVGGGDKHFTVERYWKDLLIDGLINGLMGPAPIEIEIEEIRFISAPTLTLKAVSMCPPLTPLLVE